jgi:hypothetical protein
MGLALLLTLLSQVDVEKLDDGERRDAVKTASREELAEVMQKSPPRALIDAGKQAVAALGMYSYRMGKTERVKGTLLDEQTIDVVVKEAPFAVRLEYVKGPGAGRKVLYNTKARTDDFRVHETGFFSLFGGLWISCDSSLAKSDSNHTIKEAGIGRLLARFESDLVRGESMGGFKVTHEGWTADGIWCSLYFPPNGGRDFSGYKTRICSDLTAGLPVRVETFDEKGNLLERYLFSQVKTVVKPDAFFDPDKF